jgi:uncharacterized metal-binding protein YceD (DUF177 family)
MIFEGEHIEIDDIIHEHLILALSPILKPECNGNGDCLICGKAPEGKDAQRGDTVNLGDLIKKAQKK